MISPLTPVDTLPKTSPVKILLVDDNVDAADTMQALLEMDGYEVKVAYGGVAAVEAARRAQHDIVVMDIGMPGMNGYEAARLIRGLPGNETVRLVALTGWGESTDRQLASDAGFNDHLVKPVDYALLLKCLES